MSVRNESDLAETKAMFVRLMSEDERVLDEPAAPSVFLTNASAAGVDLFAACWVKNEDWFSVRSDLLSRLVDVFNRDSRLGMSLPAQEIHLVQDRGGSGKSG